MSKHLLVLARTDLSCTYFVVNDKNKILLPTQYFFRRFKDIWKFLHYFRDIIIESNEIT